MRKITDMLSKEVVSVAEGEILGIVTNGYTDEKLARVRGFKVSREESDEPRALPIRRLLGEGEALTVTAESALKGLTDRECPLGVKVFDSTGKYLGLLRDVLFDEGDGTVTSLAVGEDEISASSVIRFGRNALLLRAPAHEKKVFRRKTGEHVPRRTKKPKATGILPSQAGEQGAEDAPLLPAKIEGADAPRQDYTFLLGRSVLRTIGTANAPIAKAGDTVTPEILWKARESGKLVELTVNSKRG